VRGSGRDHRDPDEGGQGERKDSGGTHIELMCRKRDIRSGLWRVVEVVYVFGENERSGRR
jgi:hypothetical protein